MPALLLTHFTILIVKIRHRKDVSEIYLYIKKVYCLTLPEVLIWPTQKFINKLKKPGHLIGQRNQSFGVVFLQSFILLDMINKFSML